MFGGLKNLVSRLFGGAQPQQKTPPPQPITNNPRVDPRQLQQAMAQRFAPQQSIWNKVVDQFSANTQADNFRRYQQMQSIATDNAIRSIQQATRQGRINPNVAAAQIRALSLNSAVQPNTVTPNQFDLNPVQMAGQQVINAATNRKAAPVFMGIGRSGAGTAEGLAGLYDLLTPGQGQNRFGKIAKNAGATADKVVNREGYNKLAYTGGQAFGDIATFMAAGAPLAKGVSTATKVAGKAPVIGKAIASIDDAAKAGNLAARGAKYLARPDVLSDIISDTALNAGLRSNRGKEVTPASMLADAGMSVGMGSGIGLAGLGAKQVYKAGKKAAPEVADAAKKVKYTTDKLDPSVLELDRQYDQLSKQWQTATPRTRKQIEGAIKQNRMMRNQYTQVAFGNSIQDVTGNPRFDDELSAAQARLDRLDQLGKLADQQSKAIDNLNKIGKSGSLPSGSPQDFARFVDQPGEVPISPAISPKNNPQLPLRNPNNTPVPLAPSSSKGIQNRQIPGTGLADPTTGRLNNQNDQVVLGTQKPLGKSKVLQPAPEGTPTSREGLVSSTEQLPPESPNQMPGTGQTTGSYNRNLQQRGFKVNLSKDTETPHAVFSGIPGYNVKPNKQTIGNATKRVAQDPEGTFDRLIQKGAKTTEDNADALVLLRNLVENDELDKAQKLAMATAKNATSAGQAVQIFSAFRKTTPDGALRDVYSRINAYNKAHPNKTPIDLSPEQASNITKLANELQKLEPNSREWAVKAAQLEREKGLAIPHSIWASVSQVQTMAQLLNPKTFIRNVIGNTVLDLGEDASRVTAAGIDKVLYKMGLIDSRNVVVPNLKTNWLAKLTGFKQGAEDVKLGIRTQGAAGNYDLSRELFKPGSTGNKLEKVLGYELSTFDKAFYTGRYQSSLENIMKAQGAKVATPEMKAIADAEALYATFQNNSAIAKALTATKRGLNAGKDWGVGDLVLKYPKTPGNIVSVGLDYSPVGFAKGLKGLYDGIQQGDTGILRGGEINLGRSLTGTGLIIGGAYLAKQGIITGRKEQDKDQAAANMANGQSPFSFNITALGRLLRGEDAKTRPGDITANYDWLQPNAIQLTMGANMVINKNDANAQVNDALQALGTGLDTVSEQPVFQGVTRFAQNLNSQNGGGVGKAVGGLLTDMPASFTPSSINQLGQLTDNTKRSTYDPSQFKQGVNKVKARFPVARNTLQPSVNILGQDQQQYDVGGNNPFNVFFNPSFVKRVKNEPAINLSNELNQSTGEVSQFPSVTNTKQMVDGKNVKLNAKQNTKFQRYVGENTNQAYTDIQQDNRFQALSDADKVKVLNNLKVDINAAARNKILGDSFDKNKESVQSIIDDNLARAIDLKLQSKEKSVKKTAIKQPKTKKVAKAKSTRKRSGAKVAKTPTVRLRVPGRLKLTVGKAPKLAKARKLRTVAVSTRKPRKIRLKV